MAEQMDIKLPSNEEQEFEIFCSELPSNEPQSIYFGLLNELYHSITTNNLSKFEKYLKFTIHFNDIHHNKSDFKEWLLHAENPMRSTDLLILCSKFNRTNFLDFIFNNHCYLKNESLQSFKGLQQKDNENHNALYYAIRNDNIEVVEKILEHWSLLESSNAAITMDQILAETYDEVLLKNINLSDEMKLLIDERLFELRFKCDYSKQDMRARNNVTDDEAKIQLSLRLDFVLDNIKMINSNYSDGAEFDQQLLFLCQSLAKDIHILKKKLPSTYCTMPWEEIEFILITFVLYNTEKHKINLFFSSTLRNGKFFKHLNTFARKLEAEKSKMIENYKKSTRHPRVERHMQVEVLKKEDADIKDLIEDYETIRDAYTFRKITTAIDLALSVNSSEQNGLLIVNRVLQLIGEHLKNTWESPNLSESSCNFMLLITPKSTRDNLKKLRDSLSHSESLLKRISSADTISDFSYITNMQHDLRKIRKIINTVVDSKELKIIHQFLMEIMECKTVDELIDVANIFSKIKIDPTDFIMKPGEEESEIKKLVTELESLIKAKDSESYALVQQLKNLLDNAKHELNLIGNNKFQGYNTIGLIYKKMQTTSIASDDVKSIKDLVRKTIINMHLTVEYDNLKRIDGIANSLYRYFKLRSTEEDNSKDNEYKILEILANIAILCQVSCNQMRCIEDLKYEICHKSSKKSSEKVDMSHLIPKLFEVLDKLLSGYKWHNFDSDKKLQAAVQMILLDILSLLTSVDKFMFISNVTYLDQSHPFLMAKDLRNYLAHHHSIIDILSLNAGRCLFFNAITLLREFKNGNFDKAPQITIGERINEDLKNCQYRFKQQLKQLRIQNELFMAQQNGQSNEIKQCLQNGGDLKGRDVHQKTCLHYAAKSENLEVFELLLNAGLNLNSTDDNDYTPVDVSVESNNIEVTRYCLAKCKFDVNRVKKNPFSPTLLHIAAKSCTSDMIRLLLKYNANKKAEFYDYLPLHLSIVCKNVEAAKVLIDHLKDGNSLPYSDFTLLHMAAEMHLIELVDILISKGANIHARNEKSATVLHMACMGGCHEIVNRLLQHDPKFNINETNVEGYAAIHYACETGNHKVFEILLNHGANCNIADMFGDTCLHFVCKNGHTETVKILLSRGANPNVKNKSLFTPIHYAAGNGHLEIVSLLIANKAKLAEKAIANLTPLYSAAQNGHLDVVKLLIDNGAPSIQSKLQTDIHLEPVTAACLNGHLEIVKILLAKSEVTPEIATHLLELGASKGHENIVSYFLNLNGKITEKLIKPAAQYISVLDVFLQKSKKINEFDADGFAVIHYASIHGNYEIVNRLIENKVDIALMTKTKNERPISALGLAVRSNRIAIVNLLLKNGAFKTQNNIVMLKDIIELHNLDAMRILIEKKALSDSDKLTSIKIAIYLGYVEILELLLKHIDAQMIKKPDVGASLLCMSAVRGNKRVCQMILAKGVDVNSKLITDFNQTPLYISVSKGSYEMTNFFIENSGNVNCKTLEGITPLIYASKFGYADIVQLLLENGADINQKDNEGRTALEFAVSTNKLDCAQTLVNTKKVDLNKVGNARFSLLHIAAQEGSLEVTSFLCDNGANMYAKNEGGSKPIHLAAREGQINVVEYYLKKGVSIDEPSGNNYFGPLHLAAAANQLEMIKYLIKQGAKLNLEGLCRFTPLDAAFQRNSYEAVTLLLNLGAVCTNRPSYFRNNKESMNLIISSQELFEYIKTANHNKIEQLIKGNNAQVNAKNEKDATILHIASWKGYSECVKIILSNKGDPNIVGKGMSTALHYAAKFNHLDIVNDLLTYGAIYNLKTDAGKTAFDLTADAKIKSLLGLISKTFKGIQNKSLRIIKDLSEIKDLKTIKAIVYAQNENGETIMLTAMKTLYPHAVSLQQIHQKIDSIELQMKYSELSSVERFDELITFLWQVRKNRSELFGKDCPGNLYLDSLVAHTTYYQGKYSDALRLTDQLLEKEKKTFGSNSKYALKTMALKSLILFRQGRTMDALKIIEEVNQEQQKILESTDEDYIGTQNTLGLIYQELKRFDEALEAYTKSYNAWKSSQGINSQAALAAQNNIGLVLGYMGKKSEALKTLNEVYKRRLKYLGPKHSDTLRTRQNICRIETLDKKYDNTLEELKKLLEKQVKTLGSDHVDTLKTEAELGRVLFHQNKLYLAHNHLQNVLPKMAEKLGPENLEYLHYKQIMELIKTTSFDTGRNDSEVVFQQLSNNFIEAIERNDIDLVKTIFNKGANVNGKDTDGFTPLHFATRNNSKEILVYLLNNAADPTQISNKGNTPLHLAALKGYLDIAEILLRHVRENNYANFYTFINGKTKNGMMTALHVAAKHGFVNLVKLLLTNGAIFELHEAKGLKPVDLTTNTEIKHLLKCCDDLFSSAHIKGADALEDYVSMLRNIPNINLILSKAQNKNNDNILQAIVKSTADVEKCETIMRKLGFNFNSTNLS